MNLVSFIYFLLCLTSGLLLVRLLPLPRWLALLIGPATGLITITEIILITSLVIGYSHISILVSLILVLVAAVLLNKKYGSSLQTEKVSFRALWPLVLMFASVVVFSMHIFTTQVLAPTQNGLATGGGGMYGDTALHSAYTMSIVEGGIPPKNPLFAPQPLIYPFLVNLYSASLVTLGSNLRFAFVLPQFVYLIAFVSLFYFVAKQVTSNKAAFVTMLLFFLGWGFGFMTYFEEAQTTGTWTTTQEYTNDMKDYHLHNPLTGLIYPERSFLPGLVIGLLITSLYLSYQKSKKRYLLPLMGILLGITPLWHTHTFLFFGAGIGTWLLFNRHPEFISGSSFIKQVTKQLAWVYVPALALSLPVIWWFSHQVSHGSFIRLSLGWIKHQNQFVFWLKNAGLVIPLALIGLVLRKKQRLFFIPALVMFAVANVILFSPWEWDNVKLFTWVFLFLSILAGHTLTRIASHNALTRMVAIFLLVVSLLSGALSLINHSKQTFTIYDQADQAVANWIRANTEPTDVFLIDPWPNHPVPGLSGRSVYVGYPGHLWVHGIEYANRENQVKALLRKDDSFSFANLEVPVNYVVVTQALTLTGTELTYQNSKFYVYKVTN